MAARVLVISRLLHTKLSRQHHQIPFLETLRNRLASLRRKILSRIDRRFRAADASSDGIVEAMCAFALATSSSLSDVTKHFYNARSQEISVCMEGGGSKKSSILRALRLYLMTLKDTQNLIPAQIANALARLKKTPMLKSKDMYALTELNLDVLEQSIGEDIASFTPYLRHDDMNKSESDKMLRKWARSTIERFLSSFRDSIKDLRDPAKLFQLREEVLVLWLSQRQSSYGSDSAEILDGLRDVFRGQAIRMIKLRTSSLHEIASQIERVLRNWGESHSGELLSLWDPAIVSIEVTNGGRRLRQNIVDKLSGTTGPLREIYERYARWLEGIESLEKMIAQFRERKWDDFIDDVDDNDDDLLDNKQALLSEDDPREIQDELSSALMQGFDMLQVSLQPSTLGIHEAEDPGPQAVFLLRVWKEIRRNCPKSYTNDHLGLRSMPDLQTIVVKAALESPLQACSKRLAKASRAQKAATRPLWEGSPELPVLPSLWAYRLLLETEDSMTALGADIWSPTLTDHLKQCMKRELAQLLEVNKTTIKEPTVETLRNGHINGTKNSDKEKNGASPSESSPEDDNEATQTADTNDDVHEQDQTDENSHRETNGAPINGDETSDEAKETIDRSAQNDCNIQRLFDLLYLKHAATASTQTAKSPSPPPPPQQGPSASESAHELPAAIAALESAVVDVGVIDTKALERLRRDAGDYWRRTRLLSGLL